jgi:hypothetical protein
MEHETQLVNWQKEANTATKQTEAVHNMDPLRRIRARVAHFFNHRDAKYIEDLFDKHD